MPDLDTLLERCRQGDDLAWEALIRQYQGRVFGLALHFMRDREEARDAAQEIFIRVYTRLDSLHEGQAFLPWLLRLARNSCIDRLRRRQVRTPAFAVALEDAPEIPSPEPSPEEAALRDAREVLLYRALGELSEKNREIILLKDTQELKLEEIAELLSLPLGTVKSRAHRARIELALAVRSLDPSYGSPA
ncbi:MAG: sigma-70 family RNA polymerase sigma factor [Thermoanaerobaculia bacterium]